MVRRTTVLWGIAQEEPATVREVADLLAVHRKDIDEAIQHLREANLILAGPERIDGQPGPNPTQWILARPDDYLDADDMDPRSR